MDRVKVSYLAAGWAKIELITGHTVIHSTVNDITLITVYDKELNIVEDYTFRDVFRIKRQRG